MCHLYACSGEKYANINWGELGFDLVQTDYMYIMKSSKGDQSFSKGTLTRYGNIEISPASGIVNYGQVYAYYICHTWILMNI